MKFTPTRLPEVILVEPDLFRDERGFFLETYHREKYAAGGIADLFVQDNHSRSARGTLRGLHAQRLRPQGKLVRAVEGEIFDVAVDIRRGSPRFGQWVGVILSAENFHQLWVPAGFAHGFCVVSEAAQVEYKVTDLYQPQDELSLAWNDPALAIAWPVSEPRVSAKDAQASTLAALHDSLPLYEG
jgi:dTDP-4-dehydrorhamnose 3,5-epimerase